ncbi:MAG: hypothetical protein IH851_12340 [Armatimonadetes bacterium]|nr:hypothetical protein [Armatimonadota bacterium]
MGLNVGVYTRLENSEFVQLFRSHRDLWVGQATDWYQFLASRSERTYRDDVAQHLALALEADNVFLDHATRVKARGKYWLKDFADLIVEEGWRTITKA